jgi:hypothetical protein
LAYKRRKGKYLDLTSEHHEREAAPVQPLVLLAVERREENQRKRKRRRVRLERRSSNRSKRIHPQGCEDSDPNPW